MTYRSIDESPQFYARIAGAIYLVIIVAGLVDEVFIRSKMIVPGDAAATAQRILSGQTLFRLSIAGDLFMHICDVPSILIFYLLLKPVNKNLSLLAAIFNLIQTAILGLNKLQLLTTLAFLTGGGGLEGLDGHQRAGLAYLSIDLHEAGFGVGLAFFGFSCLISGYLMYESGYFPRWLGALMTLAGLCYIVNTFAQIISPAGAAAMFPIILLPSFIGELAVCLWLLIKGVNVRQWRADVG